MSGLSFPPSVFTSTQKGLVPASGGGTANFLRADGSFATPAGTDSGYFSTRLFGSPTLTTFNVNSAAYIFAGLPLNLQIDLDEYPFADFKIACVAQSSEAAQTVTLELRLDGVNPVHTGGNDLVIGNTFDDYETAWLSNDSVLTGVQIAGLFSKGSNATVDLRLNSIDLIFRL